ncbi:MAG: tRNA (adenosine(37)-N6)-dimethylallyltransferase MiaA, partial [Bacteroidia bacterium]|nr:tRNA (adenosine(37)-N6)-dimethylallyltransferase MiaA [Bacteroidia bacterium]
MKKEAPFLLFIGGPTGSGKTELAIELYLRRRWPILSADSRQVYRYLDIGTNKIPQSLQATSPHFLIDLCYPDEPFSAARFVEESEKLLQLWAGKVEVVQVVGGTGFYMEALLYGLDSIPPPPPELRQYIEAWQAAEGKEALVSWLRQHDAATAAQIDLQNPRRVQRAIEVYLTTGRPWVSFWREGKAPRYPALRVVRSLPRTSLYERIHRRTKAQVAAGWLEETVFVLEKGYSPLSPGLQTLGYKECLAVLQGQLEKKDLAERIAAANRAYARRQLTWWRGRGYEVWIEEESFSQVVRRVEREVEAVLSRGREGWLGRWAAPAPKA